MTRSRSRAGSDPIQIIVDHTGADALVEAFSEADVYAAARKFAVGLSELGVSTDERAVLEKLGRWGISHLRAGGLDRWGNPLPLLEKIEALESENAYLRSCSRVAELESEVESLRGKLSEISDLVR